MRAGTGWLAAGLLAASFSPSVTRPAGEADADPRSTIAVIVETSRHPWLQRADLSDVAHELRDLYPAGAGEPIWFAEGRPAPALQSTVQVIGEGATLGLDPADFDSRRLAEAAGSAAGGGASSGRDRALLDVALSVEWMRFLSAAHRGRIASPHAGRGADLPARPMDLHRLVRETLAGGDPAAVLASVEPRYPGYARLKAALARHRALAATPSLPIVDPVTKVEPGTAWIGIPAVRARLAALGDLPTPASPPAEPDLYDPALTDAVRRFQDRHALAADGVLGKKTVAAMNVPAARRARQVELSLERWRWLPDPGRRVVVVELPRAELWAIDMERGTTDVHMRAVVGESRSHATPMLAASISAVVFRPYWVPPPGILKEEILPRVRARPEWLAGHGMEIVARPEENAETFAPTEDVLSRVARGELTLRQRPGPKNDLGAVKFVVPDAQCIAMHGTPYGRLFELPQRDRSHGCIRLEDPHALARWILGEEPGWDPGRIAEAAGRERSTTVKLREPVPVVFVYGTATVDPDGTEHFAEDIYRLDAQAEAQLAGRAPPARVGG